jgi:predicted dehydrogenase
MNPIRIGIVGCGTITRNVHLPVLLSLSDVRIAWLADIRREAGESLSRAAGIRFHQVKSGLDLPDCDVVLLALPNGARKTYFDAICQRPDVGLYVEKPFARSLREHEGYVAGKKPWQVAVGLDRRSFALTQMAREIFDARPFGNPQSIRIEFGGLGRVLVGESYMANAALAGGGTLYQMGVHLLDAALFASGATNVSSRSGRLVMAQGLDVHVEAELLTTLSNGDVLPMHVRVTQLGEVDNLVTFEFERATVQMSILYGAKSLGILPRGSREGWVMAPVPGYDFSLNVHATFAMHWLTAIRALTEKTPNYSSACQVTVTTQALEVLYATPTIETLRLD